MGKKKIATTTLKRYVVYYRYATPNGLQGQDSYLVAATNKGGATTAVTVVPVVNGNPIVQASHQIHASVQQALNSVLAQLDTLHPNRFCIVATP